MVLGLWNRYCEWKAKQSQLFQGFHLYRESLSEWTHLSPDEPKTMFIGETSKCCWFLIEPLLPPTSPPFLCFDYVPNRIFNSQSGPLVSASSHLICLLKAWKAADIVKILVKQTPDTPTRLISPLFWQIHFPIQYLAGSFCLLDTFTFNEYGKSSIAPWLLLKIC